MGELVEVARRASGADLVLASSYAVVVVAVLAEGAWLRLTVGPARVARFPTAAAMGAGGLVVGAAVTGVYRLLWPPLQAAAPPGAGAWWAAHPLVGAVVAFVAWDAAGDAYHRIGHRSRIGWASHQVHHSGTSYDLSLAWRQTWTPLHAVAVFPLVALLGIDLTTASLCAATSNAWQALLHTERDLRLPGWLHATVMTPATHRRHHLVDGGDVNLGPVLTLWDRLWGTWDPTPVPRGARYGIAGRTDTGDALATELAGWRRLARDASLSRRRAPSSG